MKVYCWVGEHWIDSEVSNHGELGCGSYCEECGSSFDVDIQDYLIPKGTKVVFDNDRIGIIDGTDEEITDEFNDINYYICPIEFTHLEHWSDHYVMLLREEFVIAEAMKGRC